MHIVGLKLIEITEARNAVFDVVLHKAFIQSRLLDEFRSYVTIRGADVPVWPDEPDVPLTLRPEPMYAAEDPILAPLIAPPPVTRRTAHAGHMDYG